MTVTREGRPPRAEVRVPPGSTAAADRDQSAPGKEGHRRQRSGVPWGAAITREGRPPWAEVRGPPRKDSCRRQRSECPWEGRPPQAEVRGPPGGNSHPGRTAATGRGQGPPRKDGHRGQRSGSPRGRVCTTGPTPRFHTSRGGIRRGPHRCNVLYRNIPLEQNTFSFQAPPLLPRLRGATSENTGHQ